MGPVANPRTYRDTPSVPTSRLIPCMSMIVGMSEVKMLLAMATVILARATIAENRALLLSTW